MFDSSVACSMPRLKRYWPVLVGAFLLVLSALPSVYDASLKRWMYNTTPSIPSGLYRLHHDFGRRPLSAGDIAVYAIPDAMLELVIARRYLDPEYALMKPVVAVPGDHVCTEARQVIVNGTFYGRIREADSAGRALPWFRFCGSVADDVVFTFTNDEHSFDSRHYGPVKRADVIARATPLWTS
ncbi:MAG: S26 family signal peptidase [Gammaproteobacteria bacterium]|nr:S26 family signal peptidase [Gammaproteobacteria bacterium]MCP5090302.1 S26 family signal peptidase [Gammaproteobacteria bacterium]